MWHGIVAAWEEMCWADSCPLTVRAGAALLGFTSTRKCYHCFCLEQLFIACLNAPSNFRKMSRVKSLLKQPDFFF